MFKNNVLLFTFCITFATINGFSGNNVRKIISRFDVYKTICGSKLYQVVHTQPLINDGDIMSVVVYQEVTQKSHGNFKPITNIHVETEERFLKDKTEWYTLPPSWG